MRGHPSVRIFVNCKFLLAYRSPEYISAAVFVFSAESSGPRQMRFLF